MCDRRCCYRFPNNRCLASGKVPASALCRGRWLTTLELGHRCAAQRQVTLYEIVNQCAALFSLGTMQRLAARQRVCNDVIRYEAVPFCALPCSITPKHQPYKTHSRPVAVLPSRSANALRRTHLAIKFRTVLLAPSRGALDYAKRQI